MSWVETLPNGRHRAVYRDPAGRKLSKTDQAAGREDCPSS
jgi:YD repeat-containing protein